MRSENDQSHTKFATVVEQVAGTESGSAPQAANETPEERRRLLLEYRAKVEQARAAQEERLAKLQAAHSKIEAELAALEQSEKDEALVREQAAQEAALQKEKAAQEELVEQRRRQVEEIQRQFIDVKPAKRAEPAGGAPKPKPTAEVPAIRRAPRFDIHAAVRFGKSPDHVVMRARNISMTGALLATEAGTIASYPVGTEHDAKVFLSAEPKNGIELRCKIVRHEPNSIVIDWSNDVEATFRVALLISTLAPENPV